MSQYIVEIVRNGSTWYKLMFADLMEATNCFNFHQSHMCDSHDTVRIELKENSKLIKFVQTKIRTGAFK